VLGEWKYCESYFHKKDYIRKSRKGTDRVAVYQPQCKLAGCQIVPNAANFEDLFFEPIDQLMRLQLLASAMEREHEMEADIVSVLHIAPKANDGILNPALSSKVGIGATIGEVWRTVATEGRFQSIAMEDLIPLLVGSGSDRAWADYIRVRYAPIVATENDLANVQIGDAAEISLNAYPDRMFRGRVSNIGTILDPSLRTAKVRIEVQNPGIMRLGMFVRATFRGQTREMHTIVPASAIMHMHDRDFVYIPASDKRFRRVEVVGGEPQSFVQQSVR
jgi:hypothetical protein